MSLAGRVLDSSDKPVMGVSIRATRIADDGSKVQLWGYSTQNGEFTINDVQEGLYAIHAFDMVPKEGAESDDWRNRREVAGPIVEGVRAGTQGLVLRFDRP